MSLHAYFLVLLIDLLAQVNKFFLNCKRRENDCHNYFLAEISNDLLIYSAYFAVNKDPCITTIRKV